MIIEKIMVFKEADFINSKYAELLNDTHSQLKGSKNSLADSEDGIKVFFVDFIEKFNESIIHFAVISNYASSKNKDMIKSFLSTGIQNELKMMLSPANEG